MVCYFKLDSIFQGSKVRANGSLTMNGHSKISSPEPQRKLAWNRGFKNAGNHSPIFPTGPGIKRFITHCVKECTNISHCISEVSQMKPLVKNVIIPKAYKNGGLE